VQDCSKLPVTRAIFLTTCKNLLHVHGGGSVPEDYIFEEGALVLEDWPTCGKLGSQNYALRRDAVQTFSLRHRLISKKGFKQDKCCQLCGHSSNGQLFRFMKATMNLEVRQIGVVQEKQLGQYAAFFAEGAAWRTQNHVPVLPWRGAVCLGRGYLPELHPPEIRSPRASRPNTTSGEGTKCPAGGSPLRDAALEVKSGQVVGDLHARHRSVEFRKFLDRIDTARACHPGRAPDSG
jgi:hypothetical protein